MVTEVVATEQRGQAKQPKTARQPKHALAKGVVLEIAAQPTPLLLSAEEGGRVSLTLANAVRR